MQRVGVPARQRIKDPATAARDQQIRELREQGLSYPQIAMLMGISVGTAWNVVNKQDVG